MTRQHIKILILITVTIIGSIFGSIQHAGKYSSYEVGSEGISRLTHSLKAKIITLLPWQDPSFKCNNNDIIIVLLIDRPVNLNITDNCKIILFSEKQDLMQQVLNNLNINIILVNGTLLDPLYNFGGNPSAIRSWIISNNTAEVVMNNPYVVSLANISLQAKVITSPFSFIDKNNNYAYDFDDIRGPFIVGGCYNNVCFFNDIDLLTNKYLTDSFIEFLNNSKDNVILLYSNPPTFQHAVYYLLYVVLYKYSIKLSLIIIIIIILLNYRNWNFKYRKNIIFSGVLFGSALVTLYTMNIAVFLLYVIMLILFIFDKKYILSISVITPALVSGSFQFALATLLFILILYYEINNPSDRSTSTLVNALQNMAPVVIPIALVPQYSMILLYIFILSAIAWTLGRILIETATINYLRNIEIILGKSKEIAISIQGGKVRHICGYPLSKGVARVEAESNCHYIISGNVIGRDTISIPIKLTDVWGLASKQITISFNVIVKPWTWAAWKEFAEKNPYILSYIIEGAKKALATLGFEHSGAYRRIEYSLEESRIVDIGLKSDIIGDYRGVRDYVPGDNIKFIHWKKSISTGRFVVKEFARGHGRSGSKNGISYAVIVVLDFYTYMQMDNIISKVLAFLSTLEVNGYDEIVLITVFPGYKVANFQGSPAEAAGLLLYFALNAPVVRMPDIVANLPVSIFKYDGQHYPSLIMLGLKVSRVFAHRVYEVISKLPITRDTTIIIGGGCMAKTLLISLAEKLSEYGLRWSFLE